MKITVKLICLALILALTACGSIERKEKPVVKRADSRSVATPRYRIKQHVVQAGETLYSIAFEEGLNYLEVAEYNGLKDPATIKVGQVLVLRIPLEENMDASRPSAPITRHVPVKGETKTYPKVGKILYSEQALAKIEQIQYGQTELPVSVATTVAEDDTEALEWHLPTRGKLIAGFSASANHKGVDFSGVRGQPIVASAAGKVVYAGSGLRGYGKLIIIKHNATYLSAYAHNERILVKEGQTVQRGQKIAEMGDSDTNQVKLHFEIRKKGKPVDPVNYLPLVKS